MLKFLNLFKSENAPAEIETMRARFERVTAELNDVLGELEELPIMSIDPADRAINFTAPEQFADEALALPSPEAIKKSDEDRETRETPSTDTSETVEKDAA